MLSTKQKTIFIGVAIALIACILIGGTIAAYGIRSPDSNPLIVNPVATPTPTPSPTPTPAPQATLSKVELSIETLEVGGQVTLSTTLSDGLSGQIVDFYNQNGALVGTDPATDTVGTATVTITPSVGTWIYHANTQHP